MAEIKGWITVNGKHVPLMEGESKQDAYNRAVAKHNEDKKAKDLARNKKEADNAKTKGTVKYKDYNIQRDNSVDTELYYIKKNDGTAFYTDENGIKRSIVPIEGSLDKAKKFVDGLGSKSNSKFGEDGEKFIDKIVNAMVNPHSDETPISNGDMQGMVEAYALSHKGVDEDAMIDEIRKRASKLSKNK